MSEHDSEDESDVLEESPCGRWLKRREEVEQHDVPGIDATYLAMDSEEGVEVVWNEIRFSERKLFCAKEEKVSEVFDRLIQLEHPNIVKLHKYWIDKSLEHPRLIFITEYMSSGSLKQFLKRTRRNVIKMALSSWTRWCSQILSALYYLHTQNPPMVHGNLNCDRIFMSHNGLIKIGWVGGITGNDVLRQFKTIRDSSINVHYVAPELLISFLYRTTSNPSAGVIVDPIAAPTTINCSHNEISSSNTQQATTTLTDISENASDLRHEQQQQQGQKEQQLEVKNQDQSNTVLTTAADLYSFGICALEMAALEIGPCVPQSAATTATVLQSSISLNNQTPNQTPAGSIAGSIATTCGNPSVAVVTNCIPGMSSSNSLTNCNSINTCASDSSDEGPITIDIIHKTIDSLENSLQRDFIRQCIQTDPTKRPTAHELIFHKVIFEVPSLRLIAAHKIVNTSPYQPEQLTEDALFHSASKKNKDTILAEISHTDGRPGKVITQGDTPRRELDKFLEEVRIGVYPLINIIMANCNGAASTRTSNTNPHVTSGITSSSEYSTGKETKSSSPVEQGYDRETRRIIEIMCNIKPHQKSTKIIDLTLLLRMDDKMNRQLSCVASLEDSAQSLAYELVDNGLINEDDREMVTRLIEDTINRGLLPDSSLSVSVAVSQSQKKIAAQTK